MTSDHPQHNHHTPDPAASLRTSGRAGLLIVAAGMGLLTLIGVVRRLAGKRRTEVAGNPGQPPEHHP